MVTQKNHVMRFPTFAAPITGEIMVVRTSDHRPYLNRCTLKIRISSFVMIERNLKILNLVTTSFFKYKKHTKNHNS